MLAHESWTSLYSWGIYGGLISKFLKITIFFVSIFLLCIACIFLKRCLTSSLCVDSLSLLH